MVLFSVASFILFAYFQAQGISAGDSGDLVTAAATFGVPHPPGYPLYTFLGWLLQSVPFFTPAWRVALLSSATHALVLFQVGSIVYRLTRSHIASYFAAAVLAGNYVFFLYSVTPEVFALLDLFMVLLLWCVLEWIRTKKSVYVYVFSLLFGLSLTHHHVILFFIPSCVYAYYVFRSEFRVRISWILGLFTVGLLPYLYILFPPLGSSPLIWNPAVSVSNGIRLITRADYGTFQSANIIGQLPVQRLLNVQTYIQYIYSDFLWLGCVLAIMGLVFLLRARRQVGRVFLLAFICVGPIFYFYASFPILYRFTLGTFERFMLPSYVLLCICIGVGYADILRRIGKKITSISISRIFITGLSLILFIYPLFIGYSTVGKFNGYSEDKTAENLGLDILLPLPPNSIVLLSRDTPLFITQYVRYALHIRPDVAVIHASKLNSKDNRDRLKKTFPRIHMPSTSTGAVEEFITGNTKSFRVFSNTMLPIRSPWTWIPFGLVYEVSTEQQHPKIEQHIEVQRKIWESLHDPSIGILSRFNHLLLSDVRDIYSVARTEYGKWLQKNHRHPAAIKQFTAAIHYGGDTSLDEAYMYKGVSEAVVGQCEQAVTDLLQAKQISLSPKVAGIYFLAITYRDCVKDMKKAEQYFNEYRTHVTSKEVLLQSL